MNSLTVLQSMLTRPGPSSNLCYTVMASSSSSSSAADSGTSSRVRKRKRKGNVRFLAAAVYHSQPTSANPRGWIQETLPQHSLLNNPLYTDATMIPNLARMLGDVHGNHFERQGVDPRDKASCFIDRYVFSLGHIPACTFFATLTIHVRKYNLRFDQFLY